jgi:DNA transposition AAA+ family ATPase
MLFDEFTEVIAIATLLIPLQSAFEAVDYIGEEVDAMAGAEDKAIVEITMKLHPCLNEEHTPTLIVEAV